MADLIHKDWITRYDRADIDDYQEVCRILGPQARWVAEGRVRQINNRWLKADMFLKDENGDYLVVGDEIPTRSQRIRIPKDSTLRGRKH